MKTMLVLGLLASAALLAPAASAHIIIYLNNDCTNPTVIGTAGSPPHAWIGVTTCPYNHNEVPAPGVGVILP